MPDARLRALERRYRETGTAEDGAAWLGARVREGDLPEERLRLAAYLGDPAANQALGRGPTPSRAAAAWLRGLEAHGVEAMTRAGAAIAGRLRSLWQRDNPGDPRFGRVMDALWDWLRAPTAGARAELAAAGAGMPAPSPLSRPANRVASCVRRLALAAARTDERQLVELQDALELASLSLPPGEAREVVRGALLPWALG